MNWTVQYTEYYLYRGVSRTNAYEFMQQSGVLCVRINEGLADYAHGHDLDCLSRLVGTLEPDSKRG